MARVAHPALAEVHGVESWRQRPFLVLKYLRGGTLAERLRKRPAAAAGGRGRRGPSRRGARGVRSKASSPVAAFAASVLTAPRSARPTTAQAFAAGLGGVLATARFDRAGGDG